MTHMLFSQESDQPIKWFDNYDREAIKASIVTHLSANPNDCIEHCKEPAKNDLKRFVGNTILNFYKVNPKNGKPSLIITRGDKTYYKSLIN